MRDARSTGLVAVVLTGVGLATVDNAVINVATPSIGTTLHASGAALQLTVTAYVLVSATLLVSAARLGGMFGLRRLFVAGVAVFTLASLACGLSGSIVTLIAARAVQGAGAAFMVAQVISAIQQYVEPAARRIALGAYTATLSLAAIAGQIAGGAIVAANVFGLAWRPIFLINVLIGIGLLIAAMRVMPACEPADRRRTGIDATGMVLFAVTVLCAVIPLTLGRESHWPLWAMLMLGASAPLTIAFVWWERRLECLQRSPLLFLSLFAVPARSFGLVALMLARLTYFSLLFTLALYLQSGLHESALFSGGALAVWALAYGSAGPLFPRLPNRIAAFAAAGGSALMTIVFASICASVLAGHGAGAVLIVLLAFGGFGFGAISTASMQHLMASAGPHASDLSGILSTMVPLATVIGVATFGSVYLGVAAAHDAAHAFALTCALFATTTALATFAAARASAARPLLPADAS